MRTRRSLEALLAGGNEVPDHAYRENHYQVKLRYFSADARKKALAEEPADHTRCG